MANIGFLHGIGDSMRGVVGEGFESAPMYPLKTILAPRAPGGGASDFAGGLPEISDPLFLMRVMRERKTFAGLVLSPEEALSPVEALRAVTWDAAVAMEMEHLVGGFRPGSLADFAVPTDGTVRVLETWLGGERVWRYDGA
ncbi:amidohydrolase family protein [Streptomyces sp. NPDC001520]|uniref:amidohydrolase family protein n=1 Tax=Streptomyces sp. NPDC001520 TaxID=3364581 RepID=UPI0036B7FC21